jgi:diguanylate cyclase (GGDEF)-like protein
MNLGRMSYRASRFAWRRRASMGVALGGLGVAFGLFRSGWAPLRLLSCGFLLALLADRLRARLRPSAAGPAADVELGLLLVVCGYAALEMLGGMRSPAHAAVYALVAFGVATQGLRVGGAMVALAALLEWRLAPGLLPWRGPMLLLFALSAAALLRGEIARQRREHRLRVDGAIRSLREDARDFRLVASALSVESRWRSRADEVDKLAQGSVETIHDSLYHLMELLKRSLGLQTCVLLWASEDGERMKLKELVTDSDLVTTDSVAATAGVLGAIQRSRAPLQLRAPDPPTLPYYRGPERVGTFLGVPLLEGGHLRGVLGVDRAEERPFVAEEEALIDKAAGQVLRVVLTERVFAAVERSKYEHERFYRASEMLRGALTPAEVYDTALRAAREIAEFDFAGITLFDRESRRHRIARVWDPERLFCEDVEGLEYADNTGLVAMAVKNKHFLPTTGGPGERVVFTRKLRLRMESLLVLPLIRPGDQAIGTFTLAAKKPEQFGGDVRDMLGVIANQVAVSIDHANMVQRLQELATTDGLTGLCNHREFQDRLDDMLGRSARRRSRVSMVLGDVDHFKKINDSYGHPTGDVVLRRVSQILLSAVRKVDLVARYGGEEFAVLLEDTDAQGALLLCERARAEIARQQFGSDSGTFQVTMSFGVAVYPEDAADKAAVIARADQALYRAKREGRNRVVVCREPPVARVASSPA